MTSCLSNLDRIWDSLGAANRARLVRAVISHIEVDELREDLRASLADLDSSIDELAGAGGAADEASGAAVGAHGAANVEGVSL